MGGLVRERKCSLVASANYCGLVASVCLCVAESFLEPPVFFSFFFSLMQLWAERWTRSRETVANNRKRTRYDSGSAACISAGDCTSTVTFSTGGPIRSSPTGHRTWSTALNFTSALSLEVMHGGCWIRRFSVSRSRRSTDDLVRDGAVYIVHNSGPLPSVK
jgi:hypothetical protein